MPTPNLQWPEDPRITRRRLIAATAAALAASGVYGTFSSRSRRSRSEQISSSSRLEPANASPLSTAPVGPELAPQNDDPSVPDSSVVYDHAVGPGMNGDKVRALQDRLRTLRYDPGPTDGVFGPKTEKAVWAFEKFILSTAAEGVTGIVTPSAWDRLNESISVRPRRSNRGVHLEVLLSKQVAVLYRDDEPLLITHISSGSGERWCGVVTVDHDDGTVSEEGICGVATTPGGVFHFERRIEGWRNSKLGRLYNPVYFNYGIAVHGATNVPKYPASRGCVRIPMHIAEYFPSLVADGDLVYVFDGVRQPEEYGAQLPVFDYPDPDYVSPASSP